MNQTEIKQTNAIDNAPVVLIDDSLATLDEVVLDIDPLGSSGDESSEIELLTVDDDIVKPSKYALNLLSMGSHSGEVKSHMNFKSVLNGIGFDSERVESIVMDGVQSFSDVKYIQACDSQFKMDAGAKGTGKGAKSDRCYIKAGGNFELCVMNEDMAVDFGKWLETQGIYIDKQKGDCDKYDKTMIAGMIDEMIFEIFGGLMGEFYNCKSDSKRDNKDAFNMDSIGEFHGFDNNILAGCQKRMMRDIEYKSIGRDVRVSQKQIHIKETQRIQNDCDKQLAEMRKQMDEMKAMMEGQSKTKKKGKPFKIGNKK